MAEVKVPPVDAPLPSSAPITPISLATESRTEAFFKSLLNNPVGDSVRGAYNAFAERRSALGLSNPGTVEGISREVNRDVFLNNLMFSGFRADFTKMFSTAPLFQTAHNFTMGSQGMPPYSFAALYGSPKVFFQGNIDNDFSMNIRANYRIASPLTLKSQISLAPGSAGAGQNMVQLEGDWSGSDFSANIKAMNPSALDGALTGVYIGNYLQALTPKLSLGFEAMYQRIAIDQPADILMSYAGRYKSKDWILSAQLLAQGSVQASYWRRLSDKVEAGVDLNLNFLGLSGAAAANPMMMGMMKNEGQATIGAKYEFRTSVFRGQVDSSGKVSAVLEKSIAQAVQLVFAGEMDHLKGTSKIGVGVSINSAGEELMEQSEALAQSSAEAAPPPF